MSNLQKENINKGENYTYKELGECIELIIDHRGKTPKKLGSDWVNNGIKTISAKNVNGGKLVNEYSIRCVTYDVYKKWMKEDIRKGDCLLVSEGATLGEYLYWDNEYPIVLGQRIFCIRTNPEILSPKYFYAYMNSLEFQSEIIGRATGSSVAGLRQTEVLKLKVKILPMNEQIFIGDMLYNLNKKIELNRQINETLESMAQAIFKSWFVDFEPVKAKIAAFEAGEDAEGVTHAAMRAISGKTDEALDQMQTEQQEHYTQLKTTAELFPNSMQDSKLGKVPVGWEVRQIQDVAKTIKGKSYKSAELTESKTALVTLKSFNRGGGYRLDGLKEYTGSYKAEQEVFAGDLIIAYTDVTQAADVIGKPAMVVSDSRYEHLVISLDVAVVRPEIDNHKYFLYGLAMTDNFQNHTKSYTTGTTVLHLGKSAVPEYQFPKPSEELLKLYEQNVSPMFTLVNEKIEDSRNLENLRDTLLPKLLSGELSINATGLEEEN